MTQQLVSKDDVFNLIRGRPSTNKVGSRQVRHRLRKDEQKRLEIARTKGFLLLTASTRNALKNAWHLDCLAYGRTCLYVERNKSGISATKITNDCRETIHLADFSDLRACIENAHRAK